MQDEKIGLNFSVAKWFSVLSLCKLLPYLVQGQAILFN